MTEGATPTPAQPSEGAMFVWALDVPVGWEYRSDMETPWQPRLSEQHMSECYRLVEARPKPELLEGYVVEVEGRVRESYWIEAATAADAMDRWHEGSLVTSETYLREPVSAADDE